MLDTLSASEQGARMVLDAYSRAFATKFMSWKIMLSNPGSIVRSNPGSIVNMEICRDDLKEGRSIFKRIFVCLNVCKKGWKEGCR